MKLDMSYEEWKAWKLEEAKRKAHDAEPVDWDDPLYDAKEAIVKLCFGGHLRFLRLYYIPADLAKKKPDAAGLYGYGLIMVSKEYYQTHGLDEDMITLLFHECAHAYCDNPNPERKIIDTDKDGKHLQTFAEVCEAHGAACPFNGYDYSTPQLTEETLAVIRSRLKERTVYNDVG